MFSIKKLSRSQKKTRKNILTMIHAAHHTHIGSCLSAVDVIDAVYKIKRKNEPFILSNGHSGIALYAILQKYGFMKDASQVKKLYIHPDRNIDIDIYVSTGSLGQGLPIALGMAMANRNQNVYCMISDGECTEGSIWEALRVASANNVTNLKILVNANGWGAYDPIIVEALRTRMKSFGFKIVTVAGHDTNRILKALKKTSNKPIIIFAKTSVEQFPFLKGQDAHYYKMRDEDYKLAMEMLR